MLNEGLKRCVDCKLYPNDCGYWDKDFRKKNNGVKKDTEHNCQDFIPLQRTLSKKLTDKQFQIVLANIERKRMDFEEDSFQAGYIQALLNYRIISLEQYENHYDIKPYTRKEIK